MAAAFGSGALFSIVSGVGTPNPVVNAITTGVAFAVFQGGFFMVSTLLSLSINEIWSHFTVLGINRLYVYCIAYFIAISALREIDVETGLLSYVWKVCIGHLMIIVFLLNWGYISQFKFFPCF